MNTACLSRLSAPREAKGKVATPHLLAPAHQPAAKAAPIEMRPTAAGASSFSVGSFPGSGQWLSDRSPAANGWLSDQSTDQRRPLLLASGMTACGSGPSAAEAAAAPWWYLLVSVVCERDRSFWGFPIPSLVTLLIHSVDHTGPCDGCQSGPFAYRVTSSPCLFA